MALIRIVYFSENRIDVSRRYGRIAQFLKTAVRHNRRNKVTGALLHDDLWFVQFLEGERSAVQATFDGILKDPRHANVTIISKTDTASRSI